MDIHTIQKQGYMVSMLLKFYKVVIRIKRAKKKGFKAVVMKRKKSGQTVVETI